jgi:sec-independent protein translocase protein TatC
LAEREETLIDHLEALRRMLLWCFGATALLFPLGYLVAPHVIDWLVAWSFPAGVGKLYYFAPMEVFIVQLKLALVLALVFAFPWNIWQLWRFLLPALYANERRALSRWLIAASVLFFAGIAFCIALILPLLMRFSTDFATAQLQPMLGLANFLELAGWLMLAFGVMFQAPIAVLLCVRFGVITPASLKQKRPYVMTAILIIAAILTPPDVVSQLMLAIPTWLLFELGLWISQRMEKIQ